MRRLEKLSLSVQLTPPEYYEGGEFEFPDDKEKFNVEDSKEQGTVIFFSIIYETWSKTSYKRHKI